MMNLKLPSNAAKLTTPSVSLENRSVQRLVGLPIKAEPRLF